MDSLKRSEVKTGIQRIIIFSYFLLISSAVNFQWFGYFDDLRIWTRLLLPTLLCFSYFSSIYQSKYSGLLSRITFWFYVLIALTDILPTEYELMQLSYATNTEVAIKLVFMSISIGLLFLCIYILNHNKQEPERPFFRFKS